LKWIDRAAAIAAEYARGVGIVDHHNCAVFFRHIAQAGQRADVAIHRKDSIADQQLPAGLILYAGEFALRRGQRLCGGKTRIFAFDKRAPSMIDA